MNHMHMTCKTVRKNVQAVPRVMQKKQAVPHVAKKQAVPHIMQKTSCSTCHAKTMQQTSCSTCCKNHAKNKLFHMLQKTMQKPCKMRRVRSANPLNIHSSRVPCYMCYMYYISQGKPLNIHSPRDPCYMCYMCYISQGKPLNIHSPRVPCYMCYMCYISQGKPLNIHCFRVPCYMCYMCYMALYSTPPRSGFRLRSTPRSVFRLRCGSDAMGSASLPELGFIPKNPSPGQRRRSVSDAVLAVSLTECFFSPLARPAVNPAVATGLPLSILLWQQDCSTQSCCGNRIAPPNPAVATGLLHPILLWQQDCPCQSCCGNRIAIVNPAVATGLLHPILLWQQDCPGALRAARAWNCSCPSTSL